MAGAGVGAGAGTGEETGVQISKTVLKICCKSSSEYLEISVAVAGDLNLRGLADYLKNSDIEGEKELARATEKRY